MEASQTRAMVRPIRSARPLALDTGEPLSTITAQISVTSQGLARLLSISGMQDRFILSSLDGSVTVQATLAVATVPEGEQALGDGSLTLDWSRGTLAHGERRTTLSRMELRLLAALIDSAPRPVGRQALVRRLWPDGEERSRENALKVWVWQLRRHFTAIGCPDAIRTLRGMGYVLAIPGVRAADAGLSLAREP